MKWAGLLPCSFCNGSFQTSIGTLSLAFFDSLHAQGLSTSVPKDSYIRSRQAALSHESQRETWAWHSNIVFFNSIYLHTRMAQKFAFIVLFTLAILGGFARAAPCSRYFPRTTRQAPSIPASCETQLLPAQLQALKQQVRGALVSIRDEMEEVVNGTLKGTTVSVARSTANFFTVKLQPYYILMPSFLMQGPASRIGIYTGNFSTVDANRQNVSHLLQASGGVHTCLASFNIVHYAFFVLFSAAIHRWECASIPLLRWTNGWCPDERDQAEHHRAQTKLLQPVLHNLREFGVGCKRHLQTGEL